MRWKPYVCVLLGDTLLWLLLYCELLLLQCSSCGGLPGLWAFGLFKWTFMLLAWTVFNGDKPPGPVLHRFVVLLCLLLPAFESVRTASGYWTFEGRPVPGPGTVLLAQLSSIAACALWDMELTRGHMTNGRSNVGDGAILKRVLTYFMPDVRYLLLAFCFLTLGVVGDVLIPKYQGSVLGMLRGQLYQTHYLKELGGLALVSLGSSLFTGLRGGTFMWILARLNQRVKSLLYSSLLKQDIHFFEENKPGSLASRLHSDVDAMGRTVVMNCNLLARSTLKIALMLMMTLWLSWQLTLLVVVEMRLQIVLQSRYNEYRKEVKEQVLDCEAEINRLASQTLGNIRVVRSCRAERYEATEYDRVLNHMRDIKRRKGIYSPVFLLVRRLLSVGIRVLILVRGRALVSSGQITVGDLLAFFFYQNPLSNSIQEFIFGMGDMASTVGVISKVFSYLDRTPTGTLAGDLAPHTLEGKISFRNVTFAYPSAPDRHVLQSLSMELPAGKMTAIVGPSGGGKTSCVSLLKRLYEPQGGQVLLDGEPLHSYQYKYLHQKVTLVPQNPQLFSGSVGSNIAYGLENCTRGMMEEAAARASASGFIESLEQKYDTEVGECGVRLGEGLKQCVAIARALVRRPQVIILDEATSHMDANIQHAVAQKVMVQGVTLLVVAHQLKTVEQADHIIFMDGGAVLEQGTHQELMERRGRYQRSYQGAFP